MSSMFEQEWENVKKNLEVKFGGENPTLNHSKKCDGDVTLLLPVKSLQTLEFYREKLDKDYISLLNDVIRVISIKKCDRIEKRIYNHVKDIRSFLKASGQRKCEKFRKEGVKKLTLHSHELEDSVSLKAINSDLIKSKCEIEAEFLQKSSDLDKLTYDHTKQLDMNKKLTSQNEIFKSTIEKIQIHPVLPNSGKKIAELKNSTNRIKKLDMFKNRAQSALWFAESFGLKINSIQCADSNGKEVSVNYVNSEEEEKNKIDCISFIMDKFGVGDDTYHEFSMLLQDAPRSYKIIKKRHELNSTFKIYRTPNKPGAYVKIVDELKSLLDNDDRCSVKVRIGGDGAPMSRVTNYVTFSMEILNDDGAPKLSSRALTTLAIGEVQESYEDLDEALGPFFTELNQLIKAGYIMVSDKRVSLEFLLSGDMKLILILMGLNAAHSNFACIWCKISKKERYDMSLSQDHYETEPMVRTLKETTENIGKKTQQYGVKYSPVISIDFNSICADELHVMLRIFDVLITNLAEDSRTLQIERGFRALLQNSESPLKVLEAKINSCGTSFHFWEKKDVNGKATGKLEWTSLTGGARRLVISRLYKLFDNTCIHEDTKDKTVLVWKNFEAYYKCIQEHNPESNACFELAKTFVTSFLDLGAHRIGYQKENVTPYMHVAVYHIPNMIKRYKNIIQFSGQNIEKLNDDVRKAHLKKSNRWDGTKEALTLEKRIEHGIKNKLERTKRKYVKKNEEYWTEGRASEARARKRLILDEITGSNVINS